MKSFNSLVVVVLFYAGWFGSVLLAKTSTPWLSVLFPVLLVAFLILTGQLSRHSFFVSTLISLAGVLFDSFLVSSKFVLVEGQAGLVVPLWLISIWVLFAYSMIKLGVHFRLPVWLAVLLGFAFGPLSYKSGEVLGVLSFLTPWTFWIYAGFWAISFPLVLSLSKRIA